MNELLIHLNAGGKTAFYEQIYESVKQDIVDGRLSRGERLPSARGLAADLQISRSTVDAAYAQLVSEGYLTAKRGSGYYVCDITALYHFTDSGSARRHKHGLPAGQAGGSAAGGGTQSGGVSSGGGLPFHFLPGQVDADSFAYNAWCKCSKETLLELEARGTLLQAGDPQGEYELRRTIAAYLYRARGVRCVPEQLVIGAGNEYLLQLLAQILGRPRVAAMESPTYLQAYHTFCKIGYQVRAVAMDADGMRVDELSQTDAALAYVMPSHQFPLGCVMPLGRRLQLLSWAAQYPSRYVIEDDHDSEFRYKGKPIPSLQGMAQEERVIYMGTFSNSIMPSIRISYLVLPMHLVRNYHASCGFYASTVSKIQQMTVCRFMEEGHFERHLNKMRGVYKAKHDTLLQMLKAKPWVHKIYGDYAGLHIAVEVRGDLSEEEMIRKAEKRGLRITGMNRCYITGQEKKAQYPVLLLGFGNLSKEQIVQGVELLDCCIKENQHTVK